MKECKREGLVGDTCRQVGGVSLESCVLYQAVKLEDASTLPSIRRVVSSPLGCCFRKELLRYIDEQIQNSSET